MKLLFASDSFKGSLTSEETAVLLEKAAEEVFGKCEVSSAPISSSGSTAMRMIGVSFDHLFSAFFG